MNLKNRKKNFSLIKKMKKLLFIVIPILIILSLVFVYIVIFKDLPTPYDLKDYKITPISTKIYSRNKQLLYEIYREQNRTPVKLKDLPDYVAEATITMEDKDFYKHKGISLYSGIFRAVKDMIIKKNLQGGSTITQQLVKSALLTPERTIRRKVKEMILALWTETIYSKQEILEMYLNQVPYGGSAYGIEEASNVYFGKNAKELTLGQAALLAGLPQAPSLYSPLVNPEAALKRRNNILQIMHQQKYITEKEKDKAIKEKLSVVSPKIEIKAPHFVFHVKSLLEETYGIKEVEEGGLKVITTLDLDIQKKTEDILTEEIDKLEGYNVTNGALLVTRPPTGEILAMIGSADYFATPSGAFNVTTALRQPGSSIKPINYAIGIDRKLVTAASIFLDVRTCFNAAGQSKTYCPVNYDRTFHGPTQLRFALGNSYNIPAVKMLAINGVENFVASASAFTMTTFKDPSNYGLSLTLGGGEVKMTEMAQAFSAFANRGKAKKLIGILKIEDKFGKTIYEYKNRNYIKDVQKPIKYPNFLAIQGSKAISQEAAFIISHILLDNFARSQAFGTTSSLVIPKQTVSVKTGTTDDLKDNWTIGYTPNFLVVVWVGNNDNTPMNPYLTSGITGAAPIWNDVMTYVLEDQPDLMPIRPQSVLGKQVCWGSGKTSTGENEEGCSSRFEYFIKGTGPTGLKETREQVPVNKDTDVMVQTEGDNTEMREKTIIKDEFSTYCVDCSHEGEGTQN